ncbi:MAG: 16S rRNA (uracil(1498)-N(3))-methyltransferase [Bacteroidia bacterium]|nr:16S rRNA (uracil(1498)-N(3))-methyltransferase [Bacteroidia bacterium]
MQFFYYPNLNSESIFAFNEEESKHCIKVLRKKIGDTLNLIDGKGTEAIAVIDSDNPKKCSGQIQERIQHKPNRNYSIHLAIAPTKNIERIEWLLEKAIEIGLDEITFINCFNSERDKINLDRLQKIAIAAIKQSKQFYLPQINPIVSFDSFVKKSALGQTKFIAYCPTNSTQNLIHLIPSEPHNISILLVGPEGDFSPQEVKIAEENGFMACSLGNSILRSETAGLYGISLFAAKSQL